MPKKITTEEFKKRAVNLHGDVYDYTNTVLDNGSKSRVVYLCTVHGEVEQSAAGHLQGKGCGWCSGKRKMPPKLLLARCKEVHGNTYSYLNTCFDGIDTPTTITCKEHGDFKQSVRNHIRGKGCKKCGSTVTNNSRRLTTSEFVEKAGVVHKNKYSYTNTVYVRSEDKVVITCPDHGDFEQMPHSHLKGSGCRKCANTSISLSVKKNGATGWSYTDWDKQGNISENFKGFSLYVIECLSAKEKFIKVGKTFTDIGLRFKDLPYKFKVLTQVYHNAYAISNLEGKLHKELKQYSYTPSKEFKGKTECYSLEAISTAINLAESR